MPFDDLAEGDLAAAGDEVRAAAYSAARLIAASRLIAGTAAGVVGGPSEAVDVLMRRDTDDPQFELLGAVEQRWSLLVLRIVNRVLRPDEAVADARRRGVTWAAIGAALGVTASSACHRFGG
ncbi:hypothetical protein [Mycobacterium riyadhense]|uniref:hypothetical protein n=1 Tax=Mycobacterium riyadhense TaxID=486698 RepID=UPI001956BFD9|nr:hypothetical protein [Mycobacterium riyadhense]